MARPKNTEIAIDIHPRDLNLITEAAGDCCQTVKKYISELVECRAAELRGFPPRTEDFDASKIS